MGFSQANSAGVAEDGNARRRLLLYVFCLITMEIAIARYRRKSLALPHESFHAAWARSSAMRFSLALPISHIAALHQCRCLRQGESKFDFGTRVLVTENFLCFLSAGSSADFDLPRYRTVTRESNTRTTRTADRADHHRAGSSIRARVGG